MTDTASPITFHGARFAPPRALVDTSVLSFVDKPGAPALSLTVATDALTGGAQALKVYVDDQQRAAQKAVPGYAATSTVEKQVAHAPAFVVEGQAPSPGRTRVVVQLYVLDARRERVFVVTATGVQSELARVRAAVDEIAQTFSLEGSA